MEEQETTTSNEAPPVIEADANARQWAMLCHLISLVGWITGIGFIIGPLIVWLCKKGEHPFIDEQGKESLNFQLTLLIAGFAVVIVGFLTMPILIGFVILIVGGLALSLMAIVFPIIAGITANDGKPYRYPMTIRFIK